MKTFRLRIAVRNNLLQERREALGISQIQLADAIGVNRGAVGALECLRESPLRRAHICRYPACGAPASFNPRTRGLCASHRDDPEEVAWPARMTWTSTALALADFFGVSIEELFPDAIMAVKNAVVERRVDAEDIAALGAVAATLLPTNASPSLRIETEEAIRDVAIAIRTLSPREERVLVSRFGIGGGDPMTLEAIAETYGVSQESIRKIEGKALRKLRHAKITKTLREHVPGSGGAS